MAETFLYNVPTLGEEADLITKTFNYAENFI